MVSRRKIAAVFLLLMIPGYIVFVYSLPANISINCDTNKTPARGITDRVGFCSKISVSVVRQYYFGTLQLPVYRLGISFDLLNRSFLPALLASAFLLWREYI